ncbi:hypothetical protein D9M69_368960 [compost metagenome]
MLQCEFELAELGIGVFRLQVDHASSGRARAHHAFDVTDLLHAAQFPSRAEAGRVKTKIFMTRHDHDLRSAWRLAQSVHHDLPDVWLVLGSGTRGLRRGLWPWRGLGLDWLRVGAREQRRYHEVDRLRDGSSGAAR